VGHRYEVYGDTPIGRSRQNAELLFQAELETSPISRLHCTITDEEDHFMIRDEDSANGTYLNGERLTPVVPYRLKDGDLIELARVERGGVRLRFVAVTPEDTLPPADGRYTMVDGQLPNQPYGLPPPNDQTGGRF
jgi:pSer/pThr/pTyr-binding forkhead associated (FHA) protein